MRTFPSILALVLALTGCKRTLECDGPDCAQVTQPTAVQDLLNQMSLEDKVFEMHGAGNGAPEGLWHAGGNDALGIPAFKMSDGPRGVTAGNSTTFPVGMARGATFDPELEERVAAAIALELRAKGGNVILAPVVETLRHPAWGRSQETYGEDTHHVGEMGAAFVRGAQANGVVATPKHFAVNSIEDTRFDVNVTIDDRSLQELYIPPHTRTIEAGALAIMSAYNSVNGAYCAENRELLTTILRDQLDFHGLVMSDWIWGTHDTLGMIDAGLDVEMPSPQFYGEPLIQAVEAGEVDEASIDRAVRRILTVKLIGIDPEPVDPSVVESSEHVELAREVALGSMVLLRNEGGALPLDEASSIAVIGPLADVVNLGDAGSSSATPSTAVHPLAGIEEAAGNHRSGVTHVSTAAETAAADAAIVVVGLTADDEGEQIPLFPGGDRDDLGLRASDVTLIQEVAAANPRTIVVVEGGSAIRMDPWYAEVEGIVMAWYPGMEGGTALGQLLWGDVDFSGRLPLSIPVADADLPEFDHVSHEVTYDYFHGYRHLDHEGTAARYPFGFGLSYTTFAYEDLTVSLTDDGLTADVTVRNTGTVEGAEVVQLYLGTTDIPNRAPRDLRAFQKVWLDPGQTETVTLTVPARDLMHWDGGWTSTAATWTVEAGPNVADLPLSETVQITP